MKKYFIFSDVHGCFDELMTGLKTSGFDINNEEHIIISCGDNFDRGVQNLKVFNFLNDLPKDRKHLIRGNHEYMLLFLARSQEIEYGHERNGTDITYKELVQEFQDKGIPKVVKFIKEMKNYVELGNHIFVHGFIPKNIDYKEATTQDWYEAVWINSYKEIPNLPKMKKTIVVGHVFSNCFHRLNEIYYLPQQGNTCGIIAVDSMVLRSMKVNILVMNEDGTYENEIHRTVLKQITN